MGTGHKRHAAAKFAAGNRDRCQNRENVVPAPNGPRCRVFQQLQLRRVLDTQARSRRLPPLQIQRRRLPDLAQPSNDEPPGRSALPGADPYESPVVERGCARASISCFRCPENRTPSASHSVPIQSINSASGDLFCPVLEIRIMQDAPAESSATATACALVSVTVASGCSDGWLAARAQVAQEQSPTPSGQCRENRNRRRATEGTPIGQEPPSAARVVDKRQAHTSR